MSLWDGFHSLSSTGIGSLPHPNVDSAIQFSFRSRLPYLPQIPGRNSNEYMVAQALHGLPGLTVGDNGATELDVEAWKRGTQALKNETETAFSKAKEDLNAFEFFEPTPEFWSCWKPYLWELENHTPRPRFAKIQIAGPLTCQWSLRLSNQSAAEKVDGVAMQVFRLILARAVSMIRRLKAIHIQPVLFIDEPGFYGFSIENPKHRAALSELDLFLKTLRKENALVGLHCCSNSDWIQLMGLSLDILSFDVQLSAHTLFSHVNEVVRFLNRGSRFAFGIIPTGAHAVKLQAHQPELLFDELQQLLQTQLGETQAREILSQALWSPACGLALHSPSTAEIIHGQLETLLELPYLQGLSEETE